MNNRLLKFLKSKKHAATMIEYGLIVGLISVGSLAGNYNFYFNLGRTQTNGTRTITVNTGQEPFQYESVIMAQDPNFKILGN